ncbi:MAG TPA: DUF202 domain-containing protein [Plantibacter sp.]|uniref:DUF202 domain-containing protein n=1 Tax=unclassified Plantibacter TaxID=2624265 RepID=UPI002C2026B6|nr:DUF202 domain-containing protein [Plantibacter sp.]
MSDAHRDPDRGARPFDAGLQPERTALAWRRTGLAIVAGSLIAMRILPEILGVWVLIPAGLGTIVSIGVVIAAHRRYLAQHRRLTTADTDRIALPDGRLPAVVAGLTLLGGIAALGIALPLSVRG